jgi:hypothetical protein
MKHKKSHVYLFILGINNKPKDIASYLANDKEVCC